MSIDNDDFFDEELNSNSTVETTKRVVDLFNSWREKEAKLELLEAEVSALKSDVSKIKSETMPDLLAEMGTELWRDPETGLTVELETAVNSSLPKDQAKRNAIFDALRDIGIEEILAEEFNVTFTPNDKRAVAIREILGLKKNDDVLDDESEDLDYQLTAEQLELISKLRLSLELTNLPAEEKLGAHPSRLKSWLKKRIDAGKGPEIKEAGIWFGKHAKVDFKKGKK